MDSFQEPNAGWRRELAAGIRAELTILLGVLPFGMIYGVTAVAAGLPDALAQSMSFVVFAGSAQFIAADLFGSLTPAPVILMTTFIVNVRHLLYSASLAPTVQPLSTRWKLLLAYLLTDEAYAVTALHYAADNPPPATRHWYFLGAGLTLWTGWQLSTAAGVFLGTRVPGSWGLDFAMTATFIGIMVPTLRDRPHVAAALSSGAVAILAARLPYQLGLVAAALIGIATGVLLEGRQRAQEREAV